LREVERFERCCRVQARRNPIGLEQFHNYESRGLVPEQPDPYFARLLDGKKWWEWSLNEYAKLYESNEWPGWLQLEQDFAGDEAGLNQVRKRCRHATDRLRERCGLSDGPK
jgi:hypothetical protein